MISMSCCTMINSSSSCCCKNYNIHHFPSMTISNGVLLLLLLVLSSTLSLYTNAWTLSTVSPTTQQRQVRKHKSLFSLSTLERKQHEQQQQQQQQLHDDSPFKFSRRSQSYLSSSSSPFEQQQYYGNINSNNNNNNNNTIDEEVMLSFFSVPPATHHHHHPYHPKIATAPTMTGTTNEVVDTTRSTTADIEGDTRNNIIYNVPLIQLAIAGSLATFVADICMHPMDSIKTILQSSSTGVGFTFIDATMYLYNMGGIAAFFNGFLTYAFSDAFGGAFKFTVWELWKQKIMTKILSTSTSTARTTTTTSTTSTSNNLNHNNAANHEINSSNEILTTNTLQYQMMNTGLLWIGAALAFLASSIFIVPGELMKQQLQMSHYDTLLDAVTSTYQHSGINGFFVGFDGVLFRDVPYTMIELGLYELLKNAIDNYKRQQQEQQQQLKIENKMQVVDNNDQNAPLLTTDYNIHSTSATVSNAVVDDGSTTIPISSSSSSSSTSWYEEIGAAAITGAVSSFCTTPLDTIKTKLMVDQELYPDFTFYDCFIDTIQHHGIGGIFAGVTARMGWIIPFTVLYLPTYDMFKRILQERHRQHIKLQQLDTQQEELMNTLNDNQDILLIEKKTYRKKQLHEDPLVTTAAIVTPIVQATLDVTSSSGTLPPPF